VSSCVIAIAFCIFCTRSSTTRAVRTGSAPDQLSASPPVQTRPVAFFFAGPGGWMGNDAVYEGARAGSNA
jgi:hypothetical protein